MVPVVHLELLDLLVQVVVMEALELVDLLVQVVVMEALELVDLLVRQEHQGLMVQAEHLEYHIYFKIMEL